MQRLVEATGRWEDFVGENMTVVAVGEAAVVERLDAVIDAVS